MNTGVRFLARFVCIGARKQAGRQSSFGVIPGGVTIFVFFVFVDYFITCSNRMRGAPFGTF